MNAVQFAKQAMPIALSVFVATAHAANYTVEPGTDGRMVNLRTFYPSVGDTVTLPAADAACSYVIGNTNVAEMVEANVMRILRPGATSVAYYTGSSVATWNDCAEVIVPPMPKGSGNVYVWTRTANDGSGNWADAANWTLARGAGNGFGYPNGVDDVAMCFVNGQRKWMQIAVNEDVTVGALWTGSVRHQYNEGTFAARFSGPNGITFKASAGTAELNVLGSATGTSNIKVHTLGYSPSSRLDVTLASSLVMDCGYSYDGRICISRDFARFANADVTIGSGCSFTVRNVNPANMGALLQTLEFTSGCTVSGSGTFINDSAATIYKGGDWTGFNGTYIEQGSGHYSYNDNKNANTFQTNPNHPEAKMVVRGFPQNMTTSAGGTFRGYLSSWGNFAGFLRVGGSASANPGNRLNYAEVAMEGGFLDIWCDDITGWENPVLVSAPGRLVAKEGFSGIRLQQRAGTTYPTNILNLADLSNGNGAMLSIREPLADARTNTTDAVRGWVTVGNFADHAIGGTGSVVDADRNYKIIPWLVSPRIYDGGYSQFFGVDENGVLVTATNRLPCRLQDCGGETANLAMEGPYHHLDDATYSKINSLFLRNVADARHYVGTNRRLEITSGGIILSFYGLLGHVGDSGEGDESEAGEVYLPNRGYIWGINNTEQTKSGQIWERLIAPNGVSFAAVNHSSAQITLGGDQRGIEKDITVNAGKLVLGNAETGCRLSEGLELRIVGATSCVEIPATSVGGVKDVHIVLRDVAGYPAKISIPDAGTTVKVRRLVVRHDDGTETAFRPGIHAASAGEGVDFVNEHILGEGRIKVPSPETIFLLH